MANTTIYPYGTGGSLPASIAIVNDLTTGGADKALSAEMGKVLAGKVGNIKQKAVNIVKGYVLKKADGTTSTSLNGIINTYPVEYGKVYFASGRQLSSSSSCSIAYYNGDTFISTEKDGGIPTAEDFVQFQLTIPATANKVKIYGNSNAQVPELYVTVSEAVDNLVEGPFVGKKVAIIGDSISCIYNGNTPYWTVKDIDVGNTIQSYVSWEDVYGNYRYPDTSHPTGKTIGGVTLTLAMVDGELHSFTPVAGDVGKQIGVPHHFSGNDGTFSVWTQLLCERFGMTLLANASWSGSAITSMEVEGRGIDFTASQAWHPCTIGRCRVRDDAGNFINPDVVIVLRGTNDFSYANNGAYPTLQITDVDLMNGFSATTDKVADSTYNFRIGYYLTVQALRAAYPNATIVLCTLNVFKRVIYDKWPTRNNAFTLPDLNNVIREIANETGCGLIELDKDGITFENCYPTYISDSSSTPTHPNGNGHRVMAEKAVADLRYLLNPTE